MKIVKFWAPWCGPCKVLAPVLEEAATEAGVEIESINADENEELVAKYGVMSIPAIFIEKDGEVVDSFTGFKPKEAITEFISQHQ